MKLLKKTAECVLIAAFGLLLWIVIASIASNELIFPSPFLVFERLLGLASELTFWQSVGMSLLRVVAGVVIALLLSIVCSGLAARFKAFRKLIYPFNEIIKATPVVSFIFLVYIIFAKSIGFMPIFIVMLIVFPVSYESLLNSLLGVDSMLIEVADVFGATNLEKLRYLWIPTSLSAFASSGSTALGLGWKAGIAAEALAASPSLLGIGTEISNAKVYIETVDQFAWTFVVIVLSIIIELLFSFLMNRLKTKLL